MIFGVLSPASADTDPSMDELLEQMKVEGKAFDKSPVPKSSLTGVNLKVHWKLWKRIYGAGKPGVDELEALSHDGRSLGWRNQPAYAMAVAALATGQDDPEVARAMFESAEQLAPELPYPYLLHASYVLRTDIAKFPEWLRTWMSGVSTGAGWLDTSFPWALKLFAYLLLALAGAFGVFVFGQLLRNFGVVAYDLARAMPRGFSSNQTAIVLVALVVVPGLMLRSPLASVLILAALVTFVQLKQERWISVLLFALIAALPYADRTMAALGSYQGSVTQRSFRAQWIHCGDGCREGLDALAASHADDPYIRYAALYAAYRDGGKANMRRVVEEVDAVEWPGELSGYAHNLQGAAQVALGRPKKAFDVLETARDEQRESAAPSFNLMRARQMTDELEAASNALEEASSRDLDTVTEYLRFDRRDTNSFLIVEATPRRLLWMRHFETSFSADEKPISPIAPFWTTAAGENLRLDEHATPIGLAGILLTLLGFGLGRRTSTPCPRCGMARDPVDAAKRSANHLYCYPCYKTFVMGAQMDYDARVHNEKVLGRRETMQRGMRRLGDLVLPGLGHHVAGHAVAGWFMSLAVAFAAAMIVRPHGIIRPTQELVASNWSGQITIAWIIGGFVVLVALQTALRDVPPIAIGGSHGGR